MLQNKYWQGFFALAPFISIFFIFIAYFIFFFSMMTNMEEIQNSPEPPVAVFSGLGMLMVVIFFTVITSLGGLIFYIVHAVQNPNLKENNLMLVWILLFLFANGIGQLIYWFVEIIGKREKEPLTITD